MSADVHLRKGADVADANHLHGKVAQEVDDLQRLAPEHEDEDERCHDGTEQLLQNKDLHRTTFLPNEPHRG